jgi:hypothetical protein
MVYLSCAYIIFNRVAHNCLEILLVSAGVGSIETEMGHYRDLGVWIIGVTVGRRQCLVAAR